MPIENRGDRELRDRDRDREKNDLILMPRQYAWSKDLTKGNLAVYVGPYKVTVSDTTERLVVPSAHGGHLDEVPDLHNAVQDYADVAEGEYVVLTNPSSDGDRQPEEEKANKVVPLRMGCRVNLPGPVSFALWPFQTVKIVKGHQLQMNQYVLVRVINEGEAEKNWDKAVIKPQITGELDSTKNEANTVNAVVRKSVPRPENLSVGQLLIIKGTEVSFYMPPTGLEVVPNEHGNYVREAVTLEQLEYCVLVNQSGEKRFEHGPKVVFPTASETLVTVEVDGVKHVKFKAIELTAISGLHIKVTAPYSEKVKVTEGDKVTEVVVEHKEGDELFLTGENMPIYYPRPEHAIIKYDGREIHYATAVPKGDGRYVLKRFKGDVELKEGPDMLLLDPRTQVMVRRVLTPKQVRLWFPGNVEAARINEELAAKAAQSGTGKTEYLAESASADIGESLMASSGRELSRTRGMLSTPTKLVGDQVGRQTTFTPPRTITLNTKYDGAVKIEVWTGYAVMVTNSEGKRMVVEGPKRLKLQFDEDLATLELSTGKPKTSDVLFETVYLQVRHNLVSDFVYFTSADAVDGRFKLSYRVDFIGEDKEKWFNVGNYVKFLCDHIRSLLRNMAKKNGIEKLSAEYIDLIRDTILGKPEGEEGAPKKRKGLFFEENGMVVYDVEVLGFEVGNNEIASMLVDAQHKTVQSTLELAENRRELNMTKERERIAQETATLTTETTLKKMALEQNKVKADLELALARLASQATQAVEDLKVTQGKEKVLDASAAAKLARDANTAKQKFDEEKAETALELERLAGKTKEMTAQTAAFTPQLTVALQAFGDKALVSKVAEAMAPLAILKGLSATEVLGNLLKGSGMEGLLAGVAGGLASRTLPSDSKR
jgi:major vault protein